MIAFLYFVIAFATFVYSLNGGLSYMDRRRQFEDSKRLLVPVFFVSAMMGSFWPATWAVWFIFWVSSQSSPYE